MEPESADKNMSQEEVGKLCNDMEEENRALTKAVDSQSRKLVNIQAYFELNIGGKQKLPETKRQMADVLKKNTTERDKVKNELKQLREENRRYRKITNELREQQSGGVMAAMENKCIGELETCERRSRDRGQMEVISDSDVEEVERMVQMATKELQGLELKEKEDLNTNLAAIATATKMVDKINGEHKSKLQNQRKELNMAVETKTSKEAKIEEIQKEITMMQVDVKRKKAELMEKERENYCLEDSIKEVENQVEVVQAKRDEHKRKLIQIVKDFKIARLEYKMVMNERQNEIDYVKKQIADFQAETDAQVKQILPKKKKPGLFRRRFGWLYRRH